MSNVDITSVIGDDLYLFGTHVATINKDLRATERQKLVNMWLDYHPDQYVKEMSVKNRAYAEGYADGRMYNIKNQF